MRLNHKQRHIRMRELDESAWSQVDELPSTVREGYEAQPRTPIELIVCPLGKSVNHGGLLRLSEAFMLERITFGVEPDLAQDFSGHRGGLRWQPYRWLDPIEAVKEAKASGRQTIALTLTDASVNFTEPTYQFPLSLIVGSEKDGIPEEITDQCDHVIAIPMFGLMGSLNVAIASGIVVQHLATCAFQSGKAGQPLRVESSRLLGIDP